MNVETFLSQSNYRGPSPASKTTRSMTTTTADHPGLIQRLWLRLSLKWCHLMNRIRLFSEVCLDSDEITDELFNEGDTSQATLGGSGGSLGSKPTTTTNRVLSKVSLDGTTMHSESSGISASDVPYAGGEDAWKEQNKAWLTPSEQNSTIDGRMNLLKRRQSKELRNQVVVRDYPIVYRNLVIQNRPLKRPMNLKDLMKVLEVGWSWQKMLNGYK